MTTSSSKPCLRVYASRKRNKQGFTLVELTVVIAVIGILLAAALYGFQQYIYNANGSACTQQISDATRAVNTVISLFGLNSSSPGSGGPGQLQGVPWFGTSTQINGNTISTDISPYMGGKANITCPGGGTYTQSKWSTTTVQSGGTSIAYIADPATCNLAQGGKSQALINQAAGLHYVAPQ